MLGMEAGRWDDDPAVVGHGKSDVCTEFPFVGKVFCHAGGALGAEFRKVYDVICLISAWVFHSCWFPRTSRRL
ncbi:hypothetical protein FEP07_04413 [Burkholderia multivorans]|nr:hypothetical protein [Burkholderia multivorans]MDR9270204.1 hypothetical protein [Burkholderia multivorans]MDR9287872.1 hypothetical protein [Burkholderia multivorans]MDR9293522.1 hypothetical protein [Burkholderia multivorans]MDR9316638.1 hypothetical protein [Burkholderia multivorans]